MPSSKGNLYLNRYKYITCAANLYDYLYRFGWVAFPTFTRCVSERSTKP
jgi:hypothetical protein